MSAIWRLVDEMSAQPLGSEIIQNIAEKLFNEADTISEADGWSPVNSVVEEDDLAGEEHCPRWIVLHYPHLHGQSQVFDVPM